MAEAGSSKSRTSSTSLKAAAAAAQLDAAQRLSGTKVGPRPGGTVQAKIVEDADAQAFEPQGDDSCRLIASIAVYTP